MRKVENILPALTALLAGASPALAAQLVINFDARITIQTSCTVTASPLNFGNVGVINGGETAASTITIACSLGTPYTVSFNAASAVTNYAGQMTNGANHVTYSATLSASGGVGPGTHTISGLLPAQATPPSGIYTDNRTVYLNY